MRPLATGNNISSLLADPTLKVDPDWAIGMTNACPAYVMPAALLLQRNPEDIDEDTRKHLQAIVLLGSADRASMSDFANITGCDWHDFYPPMEPPHQKGTVDTIDDFLDTYCNANPQEDALLEKLIFNPSPADYFHDVDDAPIAQDKVEEIAAQHTNQLTSESIGATQQATAVDSGDGEQDANCQASPVIEIIDTAPASQATAVLGDDAEEPDEPLLMESLAKIFIKQHRYERAFEIIKKLSLNYPEKSVYFADQLRFLQLLIINDQHRK